MFMSLKYLRYETLYDFYYHNRLKFIFQYRFVVSPLTAYETSTITHFILETPKGVLAKSADPDQMPHNVASDLGLHYFASCSTIFQQKYLN